ncbi:U2 snRNP component prp10 [Diplonema papillatum]|nr:U2 snRNP component prp10 [Diplonema papillatum]WGM49956.1 SF3B1 [Diplonema papillatum]
MADAQDDGKRKRDEDAAAGGTKKSRWEASDAAPAAAEAAAAGTASEWDQPDAAATPSRANKWDTPTPGKRSSRFDVGATPTPSRRRWDTPATPHTGPRGADDQTPNRWGVVGDATPSRFGTPSRTAWGDATPGGTPGRNAWEATPGQTPGATPKAHAWDATPGATPGGTPRGHAWDATPGGTPSRWDATPSGMTPATMKWDATPGGATPAPKKTKWDDTPSMPGQDQSTPGSMAGSVPGMTTPAGYAGATPGGFMGATPAGFQGLTPAMVASMTPEAYNQAKVEFETDERNRPLSDAELDELMPGEGYEILPFPEGYKPITPARKFTATPSTPFGQAYGFSMQDATPMGPDKDGGGGSRVDVHDLGPDLPALKPDDYQHFAALLSQKPEDEMTKEEFKENWLLRLLLKVKNGDPQQRKSAMKTITDKSRWFGASLLFTQVLPLFMMPTLEDQERHLLVKLVGRILYKLGDLVRPFVHNILIVIEPMLIDEDYYARVEGREIISNLSKAAGMLTMIQTMNPDIDHSDEYIRNTTARAFAVVTSALGIPELLPFLRAVCKAEKKWQARHTGVKIVQQIAILMGCAVLPHLKSLIECIQHGLNDEQQKVKTMTALSLAALAEAAQPYGIEAFDSVLKPLWTGTLELRGKPLAAFLKAIGFIIPLMEKEYAEHYTHAVMPRLIEEMKSPDDEMKKIVLKVVKQCVGTDGVERDYVRAQVSPAFFRSFWVKRMALDRRNYNQLVETTTEIAAKVGAAEIVAKLVDDLTDENEAYRKMVMETVQKVVSTLGTMDIDHDLEKRLMEGVIYAFQEQTADDTDIFLNGFATVINALGKRVRPHLASIGGAIKWRLNNQNPRVREQSADLIARICKIIHDCEEEALLGNLGTVLYENLGEQYPEALGSMLAGLKGIVNVIGMERMTPPIKDLLPRLTPILKNRHEKVQENCIDLVGRIADRAPEAVPAREWTRICFELLDLLKAHKKAIRRAAVNTFGYIAKAIGPFDVLSTLLSNLKVQERQQRVCTTIAIAIVAETCSPFTVIPGLMNEYRVPETNVQNGALKAFSFMFEYIGEMGKDYCFAVVPLLEDALMDRDVIHRQIACNVVKHMALGVVGLDREPAIQHLMNLVWPNVFETGIQVINSTVEAIEACRVCLGPGVMMFYLMQGLFHPARMVREIYWKLYNNLYISCQDSLVPYFPHLPDDSNNDYWRSEVDTFL